MSTWVAVSVHKKEDVQAQTVAPVQPMPPHWPYTGAVSPGDAAVVVEVADIDVFDVVVVVEILEVVVVEDTLEVVVVVTVVVGGGALPEASP